MDLSARDLLDKSNFSKPPFETIWNKRDVGYHCAAKILGVGDPRATYHQFDTKDWRNKISAELQTSGLPGATQKLTKEMVDSARINALLSETDTIIRQLREMINVQERKLLEARRTKDDYNSAKRSYDHAREQFQVVLDTWNREEHRQIQENRQLLERASVTISQKAYTFVNQAIERTLQDWRLGDINSDDGGLGRGPQGASADEKGGVKVLTVKTVAHAEEFLRLSQRELHSSLNALKLEYVTTIRKLAETAKEKRFKALQDAIRHLDPRLQPKLREDIVGEIESQSIDIRKVSFPQILRSVGSQRWQPFTRQYKLRMDVLFEQYKNDIVDPWIRSLKEEGEKNIIGTIEVTSKVAKDLVTSALEREDNRYKRELEGKDKPIDQAMVQHLIAIYGNLVAAEEALRELFIRVESLQTHRGG